MNEISTRVKIIALAIAVLIVAALIIYNVVIPMANPGPEKGSLGFGQFVLDGVTYKPAPYRINVLLMGIDATGEVQSSETYMNRGLSDFLCLLSFDIREKTCVAIHISRDTITPVSMYGVGGGYLGKAPMQIALSHQYGSGMEDSCLNTVRAVSDLFNKITIDYYVSLNMDGIAEFNDAVGGVEVTLEDDLTSKDPAMEKGKTLVLNGSQAEAFIRGRHDVADQTNLNRMARQKVYMEALYPKIANDSELVLNLFDTLAPYLVTNVSTGVLEQFLKEETEIKLLSMESVPGETAVVDGLMEFYVDQDGLMELLARTLYVPVA